VIDEYFVMVLLFQHMVFLMLFQIGAPSCAWSNGDVWIRSSWPGERELENISFLSWRSPVLSFGDHRDVKKKLKSKRVAFLKIRSWRDWV